MTHIYFYFTVGKPVDVTVVLGVVSFESVSETNLVNTIALYCCIFCFALPNGFNFESCRLVITITIIITIVTVTITIAVVIAAAIMITIIINVTFIVVIPLPPSPLPSC